MIKDNISNVGFIYVLSRKAVIFWAFIAHRQTILH